MFVQEFPALKITGEQKDKLEDLVDSIITSDNNINRKNLEDKIDVIVFAIYELSAAEIEFIVSTP